MVGRPERLDGAFADVVRVTDRASYNPDQVSPNILLNMVVATLLGVLLYGLVLLLEQLLVPKDARVS